LGPENLWRCGKPEWEDTILKTAVLNAETLEPPGLQMNWNMEVCVLEIYKSYPIPGL
jgi:hypothetical protein